MNSHAAHSTHSWLKTQAILKQKGNQMTNNTVTGDETREKEEYSNSSSGMAINPTTHEKGLKRIAKMIEFVIINWPRRIACAMRA